MANWPIILSVWSLSEAENGLWNQSLSYRKCHQCHSWFSHHGQRLTFRSLQPLCPRPHLLLCLFHPSGEMPCVSSTAQRKPKTRKILLKGVSQQPDINILLVCRAESKPLGICGFTRVCVSVCVPEWAFTLCAAYIFTYHISYLCHWVFIILKVIQRMVKVCLLPEFFQESPRIQLLALSNIYFRY